MWARKDQVEHIEPILKTLRYWRKMSTLSVVNFDGTVRVDGRVEGEKFAPPAR